MKTVTSLDEARSWFLSNSSGEITCRRADGTERVRDNYAAAVEFYGA